MSDELSTSDAPGSADASAPLVYRYDLAVEDFNEFFRYSVARKQPVEPQPPPPKPLSNVLLVLGMLGVVAAGYFSKGNAMLAAVMSWMESTLLVVTCVLVPAVFFGFLYFRFRLRRQWKDNLDFKKLTLTISATGLQFDELQFLWSNVAQVVFTRKQILFYLGTPQPLILPRRVLEPAEESIRIAARLRKWYTGSMVDEQGKPLTAERALQL